VRYRYVDNRPSDNWDEIDAGESAAIKNSPGEAKQLLVISRGNLFWLCVNGRFLETVNNRYDPIPALGYVGLYLDDTALTGTFTNLSVYPVQPTYSWDVV
jgi:hypothetical protein